MSPEAALSGSDVCSVGDFGVREGHPASADERERTLRRMSDLNAPNISVYPDTDQVGLFDAGQRAQRRFGALFNVADAGADNGGKAEIVPPAPGPRQRPARYGLAGELQECESARVAVFGFPPKN